MKIYLFLLLFALFELHSAHAYALSCQDKTYCVHTSVSNLSYPQTTNLSSYLPGYTRDKGYCGAATAAMAFSFMKNESIGMNSSIIRDFPATNVASAIVYAGNYVGTNWHGSSGTSDSAHQSIFERIAEVDHNIISTSTPISSQDIVNSFASEMPVQTLTIKYDRKCSGWWIFETCWYQGGHYLTVKGIENGKVKLWDPWNRIYNINIVGGVPSFANGESSGFVSQYASRGLVIGNFASISPSKYTLAQLAQFTAYNNCINSDNGRNCNRFLKPKKIARRRSD